MESQFRYFDISGVEVVKTDLSIGDDSHLQSALRSGWHVVSDDESDLVATFSPTEDILVSADLENGAVRCRSDDPEHGIEGLHDVLRKELHEAFDIRVGDVSTVADCVLHPVLSFSGFANVLDLEIQTEDIDGVERMHIDVEADSEARVYRSGNLVFEQGLPQQHDVTTFLDTLNARIEEALPDAPPNIHHSGRSDADWLKPTLHQVPDAPTAFRAAKEMGAEMTQDISIDIMDRYDLPPVPTTIAGLWELQLGLSGVYAAARENDRGFVRACEVSDYGGLGIRQMEEDAAGVPIDDIFELGAAEAAGAWLESPRTLLADDTAMQRAATVFEDLIVRVEQMIIYMNEYESSDGRDFSSGVWAAHHPEKPLIVGLEDSGREEYIDPLLSLGVAHDPVHMMEVVASVPGPHSGEENSVDDGECVGDRIHPTPVTLHSQLYGPGEVPARDTIEEDLAAIVGDGS